MRSKILRRQKSRILCTAVALSSFAAASALHAQEAGSGAEGDIVVTARSKAESIQDVPLAISALSAATMEKKSIQGLDDVARFTPGLSFESYSGGFQSPVIRGQAQTKVTALETNVATFFDGIYLPRSWAVDVGVAALERVEVVKGPQSARYGRNAFAGAINYISQRASTSGDLTAEASVTVGSDDRIDYGIKANLPISSEFALAGYYFRSKFDGSWENSHPYAGVKVSPGTHGNVGGWDKETWSVSARAQPAPGVLFEASYTQFNIERETNPNTFLVQTAGQLNCGSIRFGTRSLLCGEVPAPRDTVSADPRTYGAITTTRIWRGFASWEFVDDFTASYLYGRITGDVDIANLTVANNNLCGVTGCTFQNAPVGSIEYDSHEFRVAYDGKPLTFAFGGFLTGGTDNYAFYSVTLRDITSAASVLPLGRDPTALIVPLELSRTKTDVKSVFGEVNWTSADGATRLGAEARYSWNDLTTLNRRTNIAYQRLFKAFTPRFTVERDIGTGSLLYASAAKGTKAGGFNPTAIAAANRSFEEESNWTYEIGSKNRFFGDRLTLNASLFYTDWKDIQINSPDPDAVNPDAVNITANLGNAKVYGVELDAVFTPDSHLTIDANFSYAHGEYSSDTVDARFRRTVSSCDNIVCSTTGNVGGNQIERTPRTKASVGAQWGTELPWDNGYGFVRGDVSWQDKLYMTPANEGYVPSRTLVNLRAGITYGRFDLSLWGRNVFDKKYVSNAFVTILPFGNTYQLFYGERRSFGLTLKAKY